VEPKRSFFFLSALSSLVVWALWLRIFIEVVVPAA
jgi:hypothetical protein